MAEKDSAGPEHAPEGFEWICDAYQRDVKPNGDEAREFVRVELAEGRIKTILRTEFGDRTGIDVRMWDKEPLGQKVYPRFSDGRMQMELKLGQGRYVDGWVFVPKGAFEKALRRGSRRLTISAEKQCQSWLEQLMSNGSSPKQKKRDYLAEAEKKFGVGSNAFRRAWANAIVETGNTNWSKPGPRS